MQIACITADALYALPSSCSYPRLRALALSPTPASIGREGAAKREPSSTIDRAAYRPILHDAFWVSGVKARYC
jgi:hypothetical protein